MRVQIIRRKRRCIEEKIITEEVKENAVLETPDVTTMAGTSPVAGRTERVPGFEVVISLAAFIAICIMGWGNERS